MITGVVAFGVGAWLISCRYWALLTRYIVGNAKLDTLALSSSAAVGR